MLFSLRAAEDGFVFAGINPAFEASTDLSNGAVVGRSPAEVLSATIAEPMLAACRHCLVQTAPIRFILVLPLPSGGRHWEIILTPDRDAAGVVQLIQGSAREVGERLEAEIALAQSPERFSLVGETSPSIVFTASPDGHPEHVSAYFFAYAGLLPDAPATEILACVHPEDIERITPIQDGPQEDGAFETDIRLRRHDGVYRWFRLRASLAAGTAGRHWHGVATDIHDLRPAHLPATIVDDALPNVLADFSGRSITIDGAWRVTSVTSEAAAWAGIENGDLLGVDARERLPIPRPLIELVESSLRSGRPSQLEIRSPADRDRWLAFQTHPFADGVSMLFWDVTERRLSQEAVETAKDMLQGLTDAMAAEMLLLDERGVVLSVNAAWRSSLAAQRLDGTEAGVGASYIDVCRRIMSKFDEGALEAALLQIAGGERLDFNQAYVISTAAGVCWRHVRISRLRLGASIHMVAVHEDLPGATRSEPAQLSTAAQLLSAQQEERERIAIELHDSTSQHLVALGLGVAQLRRLVTGGKGGKGAQDVLEDMAHSVQEAVREIRVLSYLMKPPDLERHGLEATVRAFVAGFSLRTALKISFRVSGAVDAVSPAIQHAAFRVMQEALSNVYRHAEAASAEVELANEDGRLVLRVADDGKGMPGLGDAGVMPIGVGIGSMRTRTAQLGGSLDISAGEKGAVVTATLPATPRDPPAEA